MKVEKMVIIRTLVLAFALLNQSLVLCGISPLPFDDSQVESAIAIIFTVFASLWGWWKDNDITKKARKNKSKIKELNNESQYTSDIDLSTYQSTCVENDEMICAEVSDGERCSSCTVTSDSIHIKANKIKIDQ